MCSSGIPLACPPQGTVGGTHGKEQDGKKRGCSAEVSQEDGRTVRKGGKARQGRCAEEGRRAGKICCTSDGTCRTTRRPAGRRSESAQVQARRRRREPGG